MIQLPEPIAVGEEREAWARVRHDMTVHGVAWMHARLADWVVPEGEPEAARRLLGRDWKRYQELSPEVRTRFAATRKLLKFAAGSVVSAAPDSLELSYGPTGRPYLRGCDQIDISLSHTDDLLLIGMTTRGLVGVDTERADRQMYRRGLGRHICTPYELESLEEEPEADRNRALLRLWTLKEAYSKAIGQGMQFRFTEFGFGPDGRPVRVHSPDGSPGTGSEWEFRSCRLENGYLVSIAVYDSGLGRIADTNLVTMLDPEYVEAMGGSVGGEVERSDQS